MQLGPDITKYTVIAKVMFCIFNKVGVITLNDSKHFLLQTKSLIKKNIWNG